MIKKLITTLFICALSSCSFTTVTIKGRDGLKLKQVSFSDLRGWRNDEQNKAVIALINSCNQLAKMPDKKEIGGKVGTIMVEDFRDVCDISEAIKGMSSKQARNFFENWFVPFKVYDNSENDQGLFTGYYVPELRGSKVKTDIYKYPIYSKPTDLTLEPYFTREEIENGALNQKGLELFYVSDPVDLFFMQVQGSGRVILEDGSVVRLGFAGKNNREYSSIGKYIIDNKIIDSKNTSYFSIKNWLKNNPEEARKVMNINQSYIFFKVSKNDDVIGSQGSVLMPGRSLAVDSEILPLGFPMWLDIKNSNNIYQKLLVAQDTGSAIKGAVRGDIFFGRGKNAESLAAKMNDRGSYYILLPTAAVDRMVGR
ncbi:MAG: murein transglycosylase [Rickettsiaceae bacterium]|jgi:membrane-bound lytic murein transglycosylase A|nr:murein transglycosylase [Rickettsiaceae bacterium]